MRSGSVHSTTIYDRSYFLATGVVIYVALAATRRVGFGWASYALLAAAPLGLGWTWRFTRRSLGSEVAQVELSALGALRVTALGAAVWLAARLAPPGWAGLDLAANLGLAASVVAANIALARIPAREGLAQPPRAARSLDATVFSALVWGIACTLAAGRLAWRSPSALLDPTAIDYATNAASIASLLELSAATLRLRSTRRLELGVLERASGALVLCLAALAVALPLALLDLAAPYHALPAGALAAALACAWVGALRDPTLISGALRGGLRVLALGAPLAVTTAALVARLPERGGVTALAGCALGALVGILGRSGTWPIAPAEVRRLKALDAASRAVLRADPDAAVLAVLESLQGMEQNLRARPELWRCDPAEMLNADVAGYLHSEAGAAPLEVYELAQGEPERVLRREVLVGLEVRQPEVRPALAWLEARNAFAVGLVREEAGPIGLLVLPQGSRRSPATLAEARAIRELCDRLSTVLGVSSALSRARSREAEAMERAEKLEQERSRLETRIVGQTRHRDSVAEVLADSVRVATYGTRARRTLRELERHAAGARDVSLEVPVGVDALAWACAFHQTGTGRTGPLVVSDGTTAITHPPAYWSHEVDAPTRRAEGGTLVVLHVTALPEAAQLALAHALSQRAATGARPCVLVATLSEAPERALQEGRLCAALAWYLVPHSLRLPALRERAEDLRGLVLAQLLASGVRRGEQPLGIEPSALAQLVAHDWSGNDAELALVVQRAARVATAERVSLSDLLAAGFVARVAPSAVGQTLPPAGEPALESERAPALARRASGQRGIGRRSARRSEASEPAPEAAATAQEQGGSERPVPKRSERVRKARSRSAAASARAAAPRETSAAEGSASPEAAAEASATEASATEAWSAEAGLSVPAPGLAANEGAELAADASSPLTSPPESAAVLRDLEPLAAAEGVARPSARRRRRR